MKSGTPSPSEHSAADLAEGFAAQVTAWAQALNAPAETLPWLAQAAEALCLATAEGHLCVPLEGLTERADPASLRTALLASGLVMTPDGKAPLPMVLDTDDRLYLHRYLDYRRRLFDRLRRQAQAAPLGTDEKVLRSSLEALFPASETDPAEPDWQKLAAALALTRRLAIISGGPGTGKTTTVTAIIACLLEAEPDCRIALAAPTGKAAQRLQESLRQRAANLPEPIRKRLPQESFTLHRLLGATREHHRFRHHAGNRLPFDALIVDEASMLDLALAVHLVEALPETARLILLGDKDQLSAVEAGAVFAGVSANPELSGACRQQLAALTGTAVEDLASPAPAGSSDLRDCVIWLTRNYRFRDAPAIGRLAEAILLQDGERALDASEPSPSAPVRWIDEPTTGLSAMTWDVIREGMADYVETVQSDPHDVRRIFEAFGRFRILCAIQRSERGVAALNEQVSALVRPNLAGGRRDLFYLGRPVLITRNDYLVRLFNGDIGIVLPNASGELMVFFEDRESFRPVAPARLPPHDSAYAMTVHKSQGSEFDTVLLLLPDRPNRVLTRELVYTGVTRARQRIVIAGSREVFVTACRNPTLRRW